MKRKNLRVAALTLCAAIAVGGLNGCSKAGADSVKAAAAEATEEVAAAEKLPSEDSASGIQVVLSGQPIETALPSGYQLTQIGTINDPERNMKVRDDGVLVKQNESGYSLLSSAGTALSSETFVNVSCVAQGVYSAKKSSDDINCTGVIDDEGNVLIPFDAAIVKTVDNHAAEDAAGRYLRIIYATGETTDENEMFFYITDQLGSLKPEAGDRLYTGYMKIYDLENRKFVDGLTVTNPDQAAVTACGDYIAVKDEAGGLAVYDGDGNITLQFENPGVSYAGNQVLAVSAGGESRLYSGAGNVLYSSSDSIQIINGSGNYACERTYDADKNRISNIIDHEGNVILSLKGNDMSVDQENDGKLYIANKDEYYLMDFEGNIVYSTKDRIYYDNYGYWDKGVEENGQTRWILITPNGKTHETTDHYSHNLVFYNKPENQADPVSEFHFLILNNDDFTLSLKADNINELGTALVSAELSGKHGLYDLLSGKELLPVEYTDIRYAQGNIYAYKSGVWDVYRAEVK